MPPISFLHVWMLAGLATLAIPIVIHLLLRRRKKRVRFSTVQFFQFQDQQSSQRRKLRHWLLLALRLLIVALLVLAFARPYLPRNGAAGDTRGAQQVIFVLDRSASMRATGTDGVRWTRARDQVQRVLAGLGPDDRAALVGCASHAEIVAGLAPPSVVARKLTDLEASWETASLADGMRQATRLLALGEPGERSTIYLVSDFQRVGCQGLGACAIPFDVEVKLLPVGDRLTPNLALTQLELESAGDTPPFARVDSFSEEGLRDAVFEIAVDGQTVSTRSMDLPAAVSTNVPLALPDLAPGWHEVRASVRARDGLAIDDTRYGVLFRPEPARVLVVEGRGGARVFEQETFFVSLALDPGRYETNANTSGFKVVPAAPQELRDRLSGAPDSRPFDLVLLPGLRDLPPGCGAALRAFVQAGGGLVLFVGDAISANRYNAELGDLLPARLGDREQAADPGAAWRMGDADTNNAVFGVFARPHSGDLGIPRFIGRHTVTATGGASVLARFDDGTPLLVTRALGQGTVALVNTTADTAWSDWPKHKTFVPWVHSLARNLARGAGAATPLETESFVAGDAVDLDLGAGARGTGFRLHSGPGRDQVVRTDDRGRLRDLPAEAPGVYSLVGADGKDVRRFAVNLPPAESDLEAMSSTEAQNQLVRVPPEPQSSLSAGLFGWSTSQREFWAALLLAVLALLFLETFWANRTSA